MEVPRVRCYVGGESIRSRFATCAHSDSTQVNSRSLEPWGLLGDNERRSLYPLRHDLAQAGVEIVKCLRRSVFDSLRTGFASAALQGNSQAPFGTLATYSAKPRAINFCGTRRCRKEASCFGLRGRTM